MFILTITTETETTIERFDDETEATEYGSTIADSLRNELVDMTITTV